MTEPTSQDLINPVFNAIWEVIKHWDIGKEYPADTDTPTDRIKFKGGVLYSGATGSDVMEIVEAIKPFLE